MNKWVLNNFRPLLGICLLLAALVVLRRELEQYHYRDIVRSLRALPGPNMLLALGLTLLNYLVLTVYDTLALRYIRHPLSYPRIALASFVGYAFSNNMGMAMIAGSTVRFRLYSAWGLTTQQIAQVVAFYSLTLWLGLAGIGGLAFLVEPMRLPDWFPFSLASTRPLGVLLLLLLTGYLLLSAFRHRPLHIRGWEFPVPPLRLSAAQILVSCLDWALAGGVLYALLSAGAGLSYPAFLSAFLLGQVAGLVSQIPGGLGVFETVLVLLLPSGGLPASAVLGALLAFRGIYYLLPLCMAALLLAIYEFVQRRERYRWIGRAFGQWVPALAPRVLTLTTFAAGTVLLFSGATPALPGRLAWLRDLLPLPVVEISHLLGSVFGAALLLLSRGLQLRLDAAYLLASILLAAGMLASLLKGLDYEEAILLGVMLAALLPCRGAFYRKASLLREPFSLAWGLAIFMVLVGSVSLGLFSHKHVEYSNDLWWRFAFASDAPRFLRAMVGAAALLLFFAVARLLRPARPKAGAPTPAETGQIRAIVAAAPDTSANLALLGDKLFLMSENRNAFIMYGVEGRSWVAMGDPVGDEQESAELLWRFRERCDLHGGWPVFYEVGVERLFLYLDLGLTLVKIGEQGRVPLESFTLEGSARKPMRHVRNRFEKLGCTFEVVPSENVPCLLPELRQVSDAWLASKNTQEKRFSLGFFGVEYLKQYPAAIVRLAGKIQAFANLWCGARKQELSPDLMRYLPASPPDIMEYLFIQLILWGKEQGYSWFNLGMAPLSGLDAGSRSALAPLWNRLGAFLYSHGNHFYNFQGLRRYKEKFDPRWEPRYLAVPGGLLLPRILTNIASLISGGMRGAMSR
ncbi:MAG: bifunctional lysylphosphatidylglycerol flippase/synthetase MprF [bacterium]